MNRTMMARRFGVCTLVAGMLISYCPWCMAREMSFTDAGKALRALELSLVAGIIITDQSSATDFEKLCMATIVDPSVGPMDMEIVSAEKKLLPVLEQYKIQKYLLLPLNGAADTQVASSAFHTWRIGQAAMRLAESFQWRDNDGMVYVFPLLWTKNIPPFEKKAVILTVRAGVYVLDQNQMKDYLAAVQTWMHPSDQDIRNAVANLKSDTVEERLAGIRLLGRVGSDEYVPLLAQCLEDPATKQETIMSLGKIGTDEALQQLQPFLNNPSHFLRGQVANALGFAKGETASGMLFELMEDQEHTVRQAAARALMHTLKEDEVTKLVPFLSDPSSPVRHAVIDALYEHGWTPAK